MKRFSSKNIITLCSIVLVGAFLVFGWQVVDSFHDRAVAAEGQVSAQTAEIGALREQVGELQAQVTILITQIEEAGLDPIVRIEPAPGARIPQSSATQPGKPAPGPPPRGPQGTAPPTTEPPAPPPAAPPPTTSPPPEPPPVACVAGICVRSPL